MAKKKGANMDKKADVTLKSGVEYIFDVEAITYGEWQDWTNDKITIDKLLTKCATPAIDADGLRKLSLGDKKRLNEAFIRKATDPLTDPN